MPVSTHKKLKSLESTLMCRLRSKLGIISPSSVLNKIALFWRYGATAGIQRAKLRAIHRLPYSPILHIRSDYENLSRTPFEVWANDYDYGMSGHCGFIDQFESEEVK